MDSTTWGAPQALPRHSHSTQAHTDLGLLVDIPHKGQRVIGHLLNVLNCVEVFFTVGWKCKRPEGQRERDEGAVGRGRCEPHLTLGKAMCLTPQLYHRGSPEECEVMYQGQHGKGRGVGQQGSEAGSWQLSFTRP